MTTNSESAVTRSPMDMLRTIFSGRMLVAFVMGFSCGLPLLLTGSVLQAWMREEGVDLSVIGLFALVGLPYTLKFLWAPILDRFALPLFGRRRGWLLLAQLSLMLSLLGFSFTSPSQNPWLLAFVAMMVTFFSASQDIVVDAYRREDLADRELGLGSSMYVNGYRLGMLLAGGGGLILADHMPFSVVYQLMAISVLVGVVTTLLAREPEVAEGTPKTLRSAVIDPFVEYFQRDGAIMFLAFILLYKLGDTMASAITTPFYLDLGFSKTEIGAVVKLFGFWATIAGGFIGGLFILRMGINRALWLFGFLQMASTFGFVLLAHIGHEVAAMAAVVAFENFTGGMGTAAFVGFMGALTDKRFTATQYALLSSLMGVPRVIASAPTGLMAEMMGWSGFFIFCTLIALPGLWILNRFAPLRGSKS
ncbi:AmpG family muropeptide MFS transporter [Sulfurirhabdus autotrophica]|uniref:PAT family beta-lactamase induction signal transducer AmpG n=1 Tax=Sulfurirhabdus autotrophica TaxID=1706046 RepID=A0A4R3Y7B7_9PROT|nr:AmpG family muropeptide MFS transporter [Sulfurirhabdus autotrophica]TCV88185.1 PAT family beta-lactamase induction signal transducer AmpG [Sulfurirhabdus autotrophica]